MKRILEKDGFTMIEVLMAIVVVGIVASVSTVFLYQGSKSLKTMDSRSELASLGSLAIERMERELRSALYVTDINACDPVTPAGIASMSATEVRFVDSDNNGLGFRAEGGNLMMRRGSAGTEPEDILATNVTGLSFSYYKKDGTVAAAPSEVWLVTVDLSLASGEDSVNLKTSVHPRGFR